MNKPQRQGDVILVPIEQIPEETKKQEDLILAYGELTGHRHKIVCDKGEAEVFEREGTLYLKVNSSSVNLYHGADHEIESQIKAPTEFDYEKNDCHKPQQLPNGMYQIRIRRTCSVLGETRRVAD